MFVRMLFTSTYYAVHKQCCFYCKQYKIRVIFIRSSKYVSVIIYKKNYVLLINFSRCFHLIIDFTLLQYTD